MIRRIVEIDEEKCTGCGACADACHEGAIGMVNGKAKLLSDSYCDGLGDCLPSCPADAISFVEREADAYDEEAVKAAQAVKKAQHSGCPGMQVKMMSKADSAENTDCGTVPGWLMQWPVQIKLVPVKAPYFSGAELLIAADCTAFTYGDFHREFIKGRIALIGCPKLDSTDYSEKLSEIFAQNDIVSVKVVRMEVPCCGGIEQAVRKAAEISGKDIPVTVDIISTDGRIISR